MMESSVNKTSSFKHRLFQSIPQGPDRFVDLHDPTALRCPGDVHPLPLEDAVLAVKREVIGKLAHDDVGKQPHIGLAFLDGVIGHGGRDHAHGDGAVRGCVLGSLVHVDNQFAGPVLQLLRDLAADLLEGFTRFRADLFLFRDVQDDLYPLQVLGDRNPARMLALGEFIFFFCGVVWAGNSTRGSGSAPCSIPSITMESNINWSGCIFSERLP